VQIPSGAVLPIECSLEKTPGFCPITDPVEQLTFVEMPAVWMCGAGTATSVEAELPLITKKNSVVTLADADLSDEKSRWLVPDGLGAP
jgi:hypothetical protein